MCATTALPVAASAYIRYLARNSNFYGSWQSEKYEGVSQSSLSFGAHFDTCYIHTRKFPNRCNFLVNTSRCTILLIGVELLHSAQWF